MSAKIYSMYSTQAGNWICYLDRLVVKVEAETDTLVESGLGLVGRIDINVFL